LNADRYLPIWIGPYEAEAITIALQEIEVSRPQTHDLIIQTLEKLKARLIRVEVISLKGDVFFGNLVVESADGVIKIDARPSDSIALAVRAHIPILVACEILDLAGITPEPDIQNETEDMPTEESEQPDGKDSSKRLSVFEEFLQHVDKDDTTGGDSKPDSLDKPDDPIDPTPEKPAD
jgi:bifunctional DNase/RNase